MQVTIICDAQQPLCQWPHKLRNLPLVAQQFLAVLFFLYWPILTPATPRPLISPFQPSPRATPNSTRAIRRTLPLSPPPSRILQQFLSSPPAAAKHSCRCNTPAT